LREQRVKAVHRAARAATLDDDEENDRFACLVRVTGVSPRDPDYTLPDAKVFTDAAVARPMLHYRFDDTLQNDGSLGSGFDGTGMGFSFVPGVRGNAVAFDTTRYSGVLVPTQVPLSSHAGITIGFWFREDVVWNSGGYTQYLFDNRGNGGFQTYHGAGGAQALTTCSSAGCISFGYAVGTWHHLIYRHDGAAGGPLEIFVDGKRVAMLPPSTVYFDDTQTSITLGTRTNMQIDDLQIHSRVFSNADQCAELAGGVWTGTECAL
jgi:hypothetical protein